MRYFALLFTSFIAAAICAGPVTHSQPGNLNSDRLHAPEIQEASTDSVLEFLLKSAAAEFKNNGPSDSLRFRNVRFGHSKTSKGDQYLLCGQFQSVQKGKKGQWIDFATVKTSDYEQWFGGHAKGFCQDSSVIWEKTENLSRTLQNRFDSLQK